MLRSLSMWNPFSGKRSSNWGSKGGTEKDLQLRKFSFLPTFTVSYWNVLPFQAYSPLLEVSSEAANFSVSARQRLHQRSGCLGALYKLCVAMRKPPYLSLFRYASNARKQRNPSTGQVKHPFTGAGAFSACCWPWYHEGPFPASLQGYWVLKGELHVGTEHCHRIWANTVKAKGRRRKHDHAYGFPESSCGANPESVWLRFPGELDPPNGLEGASLNETVDSTQRWVLLLCGRYGVARQHHN